MLKYVIALCIISFCGADPQQPYKTGSYKQLVLVQTFPITPFFYKEVFYPYVRVDPNGLANYLSEHRSIFDAKDWVISKILTYDETEYITDCVDTDGHEIRLDSDLLDADLKKKLRAKWPNLHVHGDDVENWAINFHDRGSCITENPLDFFNESLELLNKYDVGNILHSRMSPGDEEGFIQFLELISDGVGAKVYVDCIDSQDGQKQYISEVWICLNKDRKSADCIHRRDDYKIHKCDPNKLVHYPLEPPGFK